MSLLARLAGARPLDERADPGARRWVAGYLVTVRATGGIVHREVHDVDRLGPWRRANAMQWHRQRLERRFGLDRHDVRCALYNSKGAFDRAGSWE